jgi:hypothetical protein
MDDRYAKALIDELERIGDLLEDILNIELAKREKGGLPPLERTSSRRRPNERRSAKASTEVRRE